MVRNIKRRLLHLSLGLLSTSVCASPSLLADEWTNSSGTKTITGEFVKLEGVRLTIKKEDGTEAVVPLYLLDDASRLKARALAKGDKVGAIAANAPDAVDAPLVAVEVMSLSDVEVKFAAMQTAEEFMKFVQSETAKGNYVIQWDTLPPSMQVEAEGLAKEAIGKLEQSALNDILKFKKLVVETFKSKKSYLLGSKELGLPPEIMPIVETLYDPVVELVSAAIPDSYFQLETLKSTELREIFTTIVSNVAPRLETIANKLPPGMNPKDMINQISESARFKQISTAEAQMTFASPAGGEMTQTLVRVENRWIEKNQFEMMKSGIEQAKPAIQSLDPKQLTRSIRQGLAVVNTAFGSLANAESQQDVDDIIKSIKENLPSGGMGMPGVVQ